MRTTPLADFLAIMISAYGLTFTIRDSKIMNEEHLGVRPWLRRIPFFDEMLDCAFCTSFWSGMIVYTLWHPPGFKWRRVPLYGLAAATTGYAIDLGLRWLEEHTSDH